MNGGQWFGTNDVFRVLGIANTKDALRTLDDVKNLGQTLSTHTAEIWKTIVSMVQDYVLASILSAIYCEYTLPDVQTETNTFLQIKAQYEKRR